MEQRNISLHLTYSQRNHQNRNHKPGRIIPLSHCNRLQWTWHYEDERFGDVTSKLCSSISIDRQTDQFSLSLVDTLPPRSPAPTRPRIHHITKPILLSLLVCHRRFMLKTRKVKEKQGILWQKYRCPSSSSFLSSWLCICVSAVWKTNPLNKDETGFGMASLSGLPPPPTEQPSEPLFGMKAGRAHLLTWLRGRLVRQSVSRSPRLGE